MAKANYFSHDAGARNDARILRLRMKLGAEGYGVYFMLLEWLRESEAYELAEDVETIAFDLRVEAETVRMVIEDFGLFEQTENGAWTSASFQRRMGRMDELTQKRREAVARRVDRKEENTRTNQTKTRTNQTKKAENSTNDLQTGYKPSTNELQTSYKPSTNGLQKGGFVGEIENINININSSSDDDDGDARTCVRARVATPPPSHGEKNDFDLAAAVEVWASDRQWAADVCEMGELPARLLGPVLTQFVKYCRSQGKRHTGDQDARLHFIRCLSLDLGARWKKRAAKAAPVAGSAARHQERHDERGQQPQEEPLRPGEVELFFGVREGETLMQAMARRRALSEDEAAREAEQGKRAVAKLRARLAELDTRKQGRVS